MQAREPYPDRADCKSEHATLEPRLDSFIGGPLIDGLSHPNIRLHVPRIEEELDVLGKFSAEDTNVGGPIPKGLALFVVPGEPVAGEDRGTLDGNRELIRIARV